MSLSAVLALASLCLAPTARASPHPHPAWAQPRDSPFAHLFRRQNPIPPVGSDAWTALYPQAGGTPTSVPQSWTDAFNVAMAAGLIPNISVSNENNGYPTYSDGEGTDPDICSFTYSCNATTDLNNPPDGVIALAFDDGPLAGSSDTLYAFLASHNQHATHFMIGINILWNPTQFLTAFQTNHDHIAVHTWSHPYLTTKTNAELLAELGWTVQIITDSTGGLLPSVYRPPFGDTDNRVRAIAKHVFGLDTVTWNQDSADWSISTGYTTLPGVEGSLEYWITNQRKTGPGLCILEHELTNNTVAAFMDVYPQMLSNNWTIKPVPDAFGTVPWYLNAANSTAPLEFTAGVASPLPSLTSTSSSPSSSASSSASTTSSKPSSSASASSGSKSGSGSASAAAATGSGSSSGAPPAVFAGIIPAACMALVSVATAFFLTL